MTELKTGLHYPINLEELPDSWTAAYVGDFSVELESGFACGKHSETDIGVLHVRPYNVSREGTFDFETTKYVASDFNEKRLKADDVLFNNTNSPDLIGKTTAVPSKAVGLAFSNHMTRVAFANGVEPSFAAHQLHYLWSSRYFLHRCVKHVNQASISTTDLGRTVPFVCPPTREQTRIVDKIDVLFAELEAGVESLERASARLSLYRQSVLKAAFEGRLTADWRAENPDKLEDSEALLKRIQEQRAARHKQELDEWQLKLGEWRAGGEEGRKPVKPRKPKLVEPLTNSELEDLRQLPDGWCYAKVAQVALVGTGVTPLKSNRSFYEPAEVPWITSGAVNEAFVREPSSMVSQKALDETSLRLYPPHTLLVAMYGEGKTRGKCSELLIEATTNQALAALQVSEVGSHLRDYVKYFFLKNYQDLRRLASGGVQPNLNMGIIENQPFPLCGPDEQAEIVNRLEATLTNIDALEDQIDTDLARANAMRQSILKRAFSGKLVEQDSSDEPASVLLERIKAEKEKAKKIKRKRKA